MIDFIGIISFFFIYKKYGLFNAAIFLAAFGLVELIFVYLKDKKINKFKLYCFIILLFSCVFGKVFNNDILIKLKPSFIYLSLFIFVFINYFKGVYPVKILFSKIISVADEVWKSVSVKTIYFLIIQFFVSVIFACFFSTTTWVYYKIVSVFLNMLFLTFCFFSIKGKGEMLK